MTDTSGQDAQDQTDGKTPPETTGRTDLSTLPQDVQDHITRLNEENKGHRIANERLTAAAKQQREADLMKNEEYKTLAEERAVDLARLQGVEEQLTGMDATLEKVLEAQKSKLSDEGRKLIPTQLNNQQQLDYIAENFDALKRPTPPPSDAGARGDTHTAPAVPLTQGQKDAARLANWTDEQYIAAVLKQDKQE